MTTGPRIFMALIVAGLAMAAGGQSGSYSVTCPAGGSAGSPVTISGTAPSGRSTSIFYRLPTLPDGPWAYWERAQTVQGTVWSFQTVKLPAAGHYIVDIYDPLRGRGRGKLMSSCSFTVT